jgi:hypothetical protein
MIQSIRNIFGLSIFLLIFLLLPFCLPVHASSVIVTGKVKGPSGISWNGYVTFTLPVAVTDTSTSEAVCPCQVQYKVVNGTITGKNSYAPPVLLDNYNMSPTGTYYIADFYTAAGDFAWQSNYVIPSGSATWDIGTATATAVTTSNISYVNPMTTDTPQSVTGQKTFTTPIVSSVPTGTAPFTIASATKVANLTSAAFTSDSLNPASVGVGRLAHTDLICWRNLANSGNLCIRVSSTSNSLDLSDFGSSYSTYAPVVAPTTISNSAAETTILSTSVTAADISSHKAIRVHVTGNLTNTSGGNVNYTYRLRVTGPGGTLLATTATVVVATATSNAPFQLDIWITNISGGGTVASLEDVSGNFWVNTTAGAMTSAGTISIDGTVATTLALTGQLDVASANATTIGRVMWVEKVR